MEHSQANGCAEQRVRALRERLHIIMEDVTRTGVEVIFDHPAAQWSSATRRIDSEFPCGKRCESQRWWHDQNDPHEERTGPEASLGEKSNERRQKARCLIGRSLEHHDAVIITLMQDRSVRYNGSWKYSVLHTTKMCTQLRTERCVE